MDEYLKSLLDDLSAAEDEMSQSEDMTEPDPEDRFYTAACHVVYRWNEINRPAKTDPPLQTGIKFTLDENGEPGMEDV